MSSAVSNILIFLSALALTFALVALWQSLRVIFGASERRDRDKKEGSG